MNGWQLFLAGFILVVCCSCAKPGGLTTPALSPTTAKPPVSAPVSQVVAIDRLPCAEIEQGPPSVIRYPSVSLYQAGAVLPTQQGLACLEALAGWLASTSQGRWQVTVGAETVAEFEPLVVAAKRQELLARFLLRKGIETRDWQWLTTAEPGAQLALQPATDSP